MTTWNRFRTWFSGQWHKSGRLGKFALVLVPLMFGCCALTMFAAILNPSDAEPTAAVAGRSATVELSDVEATAAPSDEPATVEPTTRPPTATRAATQTAEPTATDEPTRLPVRVATATPQPATATATTAPSATPAPPTATRPPATATNAPLPTATAVRAATVALPTAVPPTLAPFPTATQPPVAAAGDVIIASIRYNGDINPQEPDEYAVITNRGGTAVNLGGWKLNAGEPDQNFGFPSFDLQPGASCRVYTNQVNADSCGGGTFGSGQAIWNNGGDCGTLYDASGAEVSRYCW